MNNKANEHCNDDSRPKKPATHDERGAADLERVTDFFEEKELSVDLNAVKVVSETSGGVASTKEDQNQKQLSSIKVKSEDVSFLVSLFNIIITVMSFERKLTFFY